MPVFGYLAIPNKGAIKELQAELSALPHCKVIPADNREVLVLVTDAPGESEDKKLQKRLRAIPSLQSLSMTFGHGDEQQSEKNKG